MENNQADLMEALEGTPSAIGRPATLGRCCACGQSGRRHRGWGPSCALPMTECGFRVHRYKSLGHTLPAQLR